VVSATLSEGFLVTVIIITDDMTIQIHSSSSNIVIYQHCRDMSHSHDQDTRTVTMTAMKTWLTDCCTVRRQMKHGVPQLINKNMTTPGCCWRLPSAAVSANCLQQPTTALRLNSRTSYRRWCRPTVRTPPSRLHCPLPTSQKTPNL